MVNVLLNAHSLRFSLGIFICVLGQGVRNGVSLQSRGGEPRDTHGTRASCISLPRWSLPCTWIRQQGSSWSSCAVSSCPCRSWRCTRPTRPTRWPGSCWELCKGTHRIAHGHHRVSWAAHKGHQLQLLALHGVTLKSHTVSLRVLSKHFSKSGRLGAVTTSLETLFQCPDFFWYPT